MDRARMQAAVKTGLTVLNAISLGTIAVSAVVYLTASGPTSPTPGPGVSQETAAVRGPRLPRPRPEEPIVTGSIAPAAAAPEPARSVAPARIELPDSPPPDLLQAYIGDHAAIRTCEDKVRNGLALPGSMSRLFATTGVFRDNAAGTVVTFDFDALNGFGFPVEMQVQCVLDASRIARLEVLPRSGPR